MKRIIPDAPLFADLAHAGQTRKYTGAPYIRHCRAVANQVFAWHGTPEMIAAAWLHDTLEDTATTYGDLVENFGEDVAHLVFELTDLYTPAAFPAWNRAKRKRAEARRLGEASLQAQVIKLADIADNTGDIVVNDPKFASVYLPEKAAILARIGGALDQWLRFRKKQQRAS